MPASLPAHFSCDAILFDLDGVLLDSSRVIRRAWLRWGERHGLEPNFVTQLIHGRRPIDSIRSLLPDCLEPEVEAAWLTAGEAGELDGLIVLPGGPELIARLPETHWTVATSGPRQIASERLSFANIAPPATMVAAEDVAQGKPHPEPYLMAAERLGVPPERCLVFEDAAAGVTAAKAAGAQVIAVQTSQSVAELHAAGADACVVNVAAARLRGQPLAGWRITLELAAAQVDR